MRINGRQGNFGASVKSTDGWWCIYGETDSPTVAKIIDAEYGTGVYDVDPVESHVAIGEPGQVSIAANVPDAARVRLEGEWVRVLTDAGHWSGAWRPGAKLSRLRTSRYVAVDEHEARRHVGIDGSKTIEITKDVELLHVSKNGSWALWSDGAFTTSIGLPKHCGAARSLSRDAEHLITMAMGSDSGRPEAIGGYAALARVAEIVEEKEVQIGPHRGHYAGLAVTAYRTKLVGGGEWAFFVLTEGYCEGYGWEAFESIEACASSIATRCGLAEEPARKALEQVLA